MKVNLKQISGNWVDGYALDKHVISSVPNGYNQWGYINWDTTRSEVGEALYQLKYRGGWENVPTLGEALYSHAIPRFGPIGLVVPVPPSNPRERQPVSELAQDVAARLGVTSFENIVTKLPPEEGAVQLKDLNSKEEKAAALAGRMQLHDAIPGEGRWNVLVIDDLYDSGASLEAVCASLGNYHKIDQIFVATLTWR